MNCVAAGTRPGGVGSSRSCPFLPRSVLMWLSQQRRAGPWGCIRTPSTRDQLYPAAFPRPRTEWFRKEAAEPGPPERQAEFAERPGPGSAARLRPSRDHGPGGTRLLIGRRRRVDIESCVPVGGSRRGAGRGPRAKPSPR